jgi:hypothetical protein
MVESCRRHELLSCSRILLARDPQGKILEDRMVMDNSYRGSSVYYSFTQHGGQYKKRMLQSQQYWVDELSRSQENLRPAWTHLKLNFDFYGKYFSRPFSTNEVAGQGLLEEIYTCSIQQRRTETNNMERKAAETLFIRRWQPLTWECKMTKVDSRTGQRPMKLWTLNGNRDATRTPCWTVSVNPPHLRRGS